MTDVWLKQLLSSMSARQDETLDELKELRKEVQTTYAREKDCSDRASDESKLRAEGLRRVWEEGFKGVYGRFDNLDSRIQTLEEHKLEETGALKVKRNIWGWVGGIAAGVLTAGLIGLATWLFTK